MTARCDFTRTLRLYPHFAMLNDKNNGLPDNGEDAYEKHVAENSGDYQVKSNKYENLLAKILCVLAAVILWFYVVINDTATDEKVFNGMGVTIRNLDQIEDLGLTVITGYDSTVDLTLKGAKSDIAKLTADDIVAYVDAKNIASAGEYTLEIYTTLPSGITVGSQSTNYISIYVDKRTTKSVPVKINTPSFTMEANYTLGTPEPSIETVNVSGPAEVLEQIADATVSFDLGRVSKTLTATGKLVLVDNSGNEVTNPYVKLQTTEVTVRFPVYTYKNIPLTVSYKYGYYNDSNVNITITPESIRVKGEPEDLDNLDSVSLLVLDEKKITGDTTQSAAIILPDGLENVSGETTATIAVVHKNTTTRDIVVSSLSVNNPNNLNYTLESTTLNVRFRGTNELLKLLNSSNVTATLDLGYLDNATGTVSVPVTISVTSALAGNVYEIGEYKMDVTIS